MKIFKSLFVIFAMAVLAIGATGAYFTDSETVAGNTFAAGEVDIEIRGDCSTAQVFADMAPGEWTDPCQYSIYNLASSVPVKYMFDASKVSQTEPGMYSKLNVKVRHTSAGTSNPSSWPVVYSGPISGMNIKSPVHAIAETLDSNISHDYYLQYQLDPSAGNEYQDDSVVFDLNFDATQTDNPGWTE